MLFTIINYISWTFTALVILFLLFVLILSIVARCTTTDLDNQCAGKLKTFVISIAKLYIQFGKDCRATAKQTISEIKALIKS